MGAGSPGLPMKVVRRAGVARVLAGLVVATALLVAHVEIRARGSGYRGPWLPLEHLYEIALVLVLLALCTGIGRVALGRAGLDRADPLDDFLLSVAVGTGLTASGLLALGAAGGFRSLPLALFFMVLGFVARRRLLELPGLVRRSLSQTADGSGPRGLELMTLAVLIVVAVFLIVMASAPPVDWDALMYHLRIPAQFARDGRIYLPVDGLHVTRVGALHMLYVPLLMAGSAAAPALLNTFLALLLSGAVFSIGRRLFDRSTALLATSLLWATTTLLLVADTARVDVSMVFFTLLAHGLLLGRGERRPGARELVLSGVLLGFAFSIKYLGWAYAAALGPLVLVTFGVRWSRIRYTLAFAVAILLTSAPWLLKNWLLVGAPLYPFLAQPIPPPWLRALFRPSGREPTVHNAMRSLVWQVRRRFNLHDLFFAPERLTIEAEGAFYTTSPALALFPLGLVFWRNRSVLGLLLPSLIYLAALIVPFPHTNLRYLAPAMPPLTLVVCFAMVRLADRLPSPRVRVVSILAVASLALGPTIRTIAVWLSRTEAVSHFVGATSSRSYVATHLLPGARQYAHMHDLLEVNTRPRDGSVLMLFEARGFGLGREVIADPQNSNWPSLAPLVSGGSCLDDPPFRYVLFNILSLRYYGRSGADLGPLRLDDFASYRNRCLRVVAETGGFTLFERRDARSISTGHVGAQAAPHPPDP